MCKVYTNHAKTYLSSLVQPTVCLAGWLVVSKSSTFSLLIPTQFSEHHHPIEEYCLAIGAGRGKWQLIIPFKGSTYLINHTSIFGSSDKMRWQIAFLFTRRVISSWRNFLWTEIFLGDFLMDRRSGEKSTTYGLNGGCYGLYASPIHLTPADFYSKLRDLEFACFLVNENALKREIAWCRQPCLHSFTVCVSAFIFMH